MTDYATYKALPAQERDELGFAKWRENQHIGTHEPGCWKNGRNHYECAVSENAALAAEVERLRKDHAAALGLVADVRFALGDNGKRMQPELIEWATGLRRDAERYQWLRDAYNRPSDEVDEDGAFVVGGIARIMVRTSTYGDATALALDQLDAAIDAAMTKKDAAP